MAQALNGYFLGRRPYGPVHNLMHEFFEARRQDEIDDSVLLLEHAPVITMGRGAHEENILTGRDELSKRGVDVIETARGGDVTLHAPGQLIAYPIINLAPDRQDVRKYVRALSGVMGELVKTFGVSSGAIDKMIGLWVDAQNVDNWPGEQDAVSPVKIGAIGVRISRWITSHGFALNLTTDMSLFELIVPCGISEFKVASVESLTGKKPLLANVAKAAHAALDLRLGAGTGIFHDLRDAPLENVLPFAQSSRTSLP